MANPTRDDLQQAYLAHRRAHDVVSAIDVLKKTAGTADLDEIPEAKYAEVIAALLANVPDEEDEPQGRGSRFARGKQKEPQSIDDLDSAAIWARFNRRTAS